jgi:hypothetical protein
MKGFRRKLTSTGQLNERCIERIPSVPRVIRKAVKEITWQTQEGEFRARRHAEYDFKGSLA